MQVRPEGCIFEDPGGESLPSDLSREVAAVRAVMDGNGWDEGQLMIHVHHGYGLSEAIVLECLASGATGIWAGVCKEGAGVGHASSIMTLTNLTRLGNPYVTVDYNMPAMREAAVEVTRIVTGREPPETTEIYGARAMVRNCIVAVDTGSVQRVAQRIKATATGR